MPEVDDHDSEDEGGGRSFWSGTIAFGLVSLPVSLYVANRPRPVSLRMLDADGTPLSRRYFCSRDEKPLAGDDLVRGFEIERDHYIEITDEELESLAPEKSREIDLRRFVPLDEIDPMFFERAYFLVPEEGASKAYRLLAQSMETMGRAGVATFVMRGKEYLVAIIAEGGILRAETLRFHDELRTPADIGLPSLDKIKVDAKELREIRNAIKHLTTNRLEHDELSDQTSRRLLRLIEHKLETDEDVVHAPELPEEQQGAEIIDLMEVLRQSLKAQVSTEAQAPSNSDKTASTRQSRSSVKLSVDPNASKSELYEQAKVLDIPGRSHMTKDELLRAIQRAS